MSHASVPEKDRTLPDDLIRLSIGIEDALDLEEDLIHAFELANSSVPDIIKFKQASRSCCCTFPFARACARGVLTWLYKEAGATNWQSVIWLFVDFCCSVCVCVCVWMCVRAGVGDWVA